MVFLYLCVQEADVYSDGPSEMIETGLLITEIKQNDWTTRTSSLAYVGNDPRTRCVELRGESEIEIRRM